MSSKIYQDRVNRITREISNLEIKRANFSKQISSKNNTIISKNKSLKYATGSNITLRLQQINRLQEEISRLQVKVADIDSQIAKKKADLNNANLLLQKELVKEENKRQEDTKKKQRILNDNYNREISRLKELLDSRNQNQINDTTSASQSVKEDVQYDVFISHASEDKESFVIPFVEELKKLGIKVWFDKDTIKWGDSIRKKIDEGLKNSKFGIVVISPSFLQKFWTNHELDGLFNLEETGKSRILPIWHKISKSEVMEYSPSLAGKIAMTTSTMTPGEIAYEMNNLLFVK